MWRYRRVLEAFRFSIWVFGEKSLPTPYGNIICFTSVNPPHCDSLEPKAMCNHNGDKLQCTDPKARYANAPSRCALVANKNQTRPGLSSLESLGDSDSVAEVKFRHPKIPDFLRSKLTLRSASPCRHGTGSGHSRGARRKLSLIRHSCKSIVSSLRSVIIVD